MPIKSTRRPRTKRLEPKTEKSVAKPGGRLWDQFLQRERPLGSLYAMAPMDRVDLVKQGVPPEALGLVAADKLRKWTYDVRFAAALQIGSERSTPTDSRYAG